MNEPKTITQIILKSDISTKAAAFIPLLEADFAHFLKAEVVEKNDQYEVAYTFPENYYVWSDLKPMKRSDRLRTLLNMGELKELLTSRYTFDIDPANLLFTHNLQPLIAERGIEELVPPLHSLSPEAFLTRFKAMAIALMSGEASFDMLMNGGLETYEGTPFEKELLATQTIDEALQLTNRFYLDEKKREDRLFVATNRKSLQLKNIGLIIVSMLALVFSTITLYHTFYQVPLQTRLIQAGEYFMQDEYSNVVSTLEDVEGDQMPRGTKYALAYSVIQTEPLSQAQKTNLLDQLSIQMNEDYLLFWTEIGKGHNEEALNIATYLDEPQITMYALSKKIEDVQNNPNLTSEERSAEIDKYQGQLDQLNETYNTEPEEDGEGQ